jgi:hypothetical protein
VRHGCVEGRNHLCVVEAHTIIDSHLSIQGIIIVLYQINL